MQQFVFATCPGCSDVLRIPASWTDKAFKCKKCGAVVRSTGAASGPTDANAFDFGTAPHSAAPDPFLPAAETPATIPSPVPAFAPSAYVPAPAQPGYPYAPPPGYPYPPSYPNPYGYTPQPGYPGAPAGYPYAPPPGYPPNPYGYPPQAQPNQFAAPQPDPVDPFANQPKLSPKRRYKKSNNSLKLIVMGAFFLLAAGVVVAGVLFQDKWSPLVGLKPKAKSSESNGPGSTPGTAPTKPVGTAAANLSAAQPRRMLVIGINKYLYCNTLTGGVDSGSKGNSRSELAEAARQLAFQFRVPIDKDNNQLFILTDADGKLASNVAHRPMLRDVVVETTKRFSDTSRGQDRILIYFGGHATFKEGKAYLVPAEGDLNDPESLIPLDEFFAIVKASPATQKVVIFDVCRANTDGNVVRPGSEPMTIDLEKALLAPPEGSNIQVLTACAAGQNAAELVASDGEHFAGSAFLNSLRVAAKQSKAGNKGIKPEDPWPVQTWVDVLPPILAEHVGTKMKPATPKLGGAMADVLAATTEETAAKRFDFPSAPNSVDPSKLKDIFALLDLRPVHITSEVKPGAGEESPEMSFPFQEEKLAGYNADKLDAEIKAAESMPLRAKTVATLNKLREKWGGKDGTGKFSGVRSTFAGETSNNVKDAIKKEQIPLAEITDDLDELVKELEPLMGEIDKEESKAWKASFLYALAQAKSRLSYLHEANLALGNILTESLPEQLDKANGLQLVSVEKMKSKKEFRKYADDAKTLYEQLAKENKGTPWEVLAKRARVESLGLEWKAFLPPKNTDDDDKMEMKKDK